MLQEVHLKTDCLLLRLCSGRDGAIGLSGATALDGQLSVLQCSLHLDHFKLLSLASASTLALASTSASATGAPPWRLLSSAASMNEKISIVSSGLTGALPVLKNFPISRQRSS